MSSFKIPTACWVVPVFLCAHGINAQTLSLQQALDAALQHHPAVQSATLQARQQQQLLPAAGALADPLATVESPTGIFYTLGVTQSFSMPGVYRREKALQKAHIARSESAVAITQLEIKRQTALVYQDWQYRHALAALLNAQDSLMQSVATAAERQFREGQTDAVSAQFARLQAATLRTRLHQSAQDATIAKSQLEVLTGLSGNLQPEPLDPAQIARQPSATADSTVWQMNPFIQTLQRDVQVAERAIDVAKSLGLPELTLGYINQGERNSPVINRFNVGVTIPLWRKQYNAATAAARTEVEIARQELDAQSLALKSAYLQAIGDAQKARKALEDFEQQLLPAARSVADASRRMYEGGMIDLVTYLRNRKDALEVEVEYLGLLQTAHLAAIDLYYSIGKL